MSSFPIAIFDSGIGGASVLFECKKMMPNENYIYIADNFKSPYGKRKSSFILKRVEKLLTMLVEKYHIKAFVIACNTASFIVKNTLRAKFNIPIFAVEPPVKTFLNEDYRSEKAILLATKHTLHSQQMIDILNKYENIKPIYLKELAKKIDKNLNNFAKIQPYLKQSLKNEEGIAAIILGCTHYHFIKKEIQNSFPTSKIYSCEEAVSKYIKTILEKENLLKSDTSYNQKIQPKQNGSLKIVLTKANGALHNFILKNFYKQ